MTTRQKLTNATINIRDELPTKEWHKVGHDAAKQQIKKSLIKIFK